jgi:thioesterase-3
VRDPDRQILFRRRRGLSIFHHEYPVLIRESHLDVFGHVNNAAYLQIFEEARWDWITRNGFGLKEIRERGIGPVVLEAKVRFQREATNRESMVVKSRTLVYDGKVGKVEQVMFRADGKACCTAEFTIALFDMKARKLIAPTAEWLKAVGPAGPAAP